jgi:hypothetical protein
MGKVAAIGTVSRPATIASVIRPSAPGLALTPPVD